MPRAAWRRPELPAATHAVAQARTPISGHLSSREESWIRAWYAAPERQPASGSELAPRRRVARHSHHGEPAPYRAGDRQ